MMEEVERRRSKGRGRLMHLFSVNAFNPIQFRKGDEGSSPWLKIDFFSLHLLSGGFSDSSISSSLSLFQFSLTFWFQDVFSILIILFCFPFFLSFPSHVIFLQLFSWLLNHFFLETHSFLFCFSLSLIFILRTSNWGMKEKRWIWIKEQELTRREIHSFSGTEREKRQRKTENSRRKTSETWGREKQIFRETSHHMMEEDQN